jgi:hypothetical protein
VLKEIFSTAPDEIKLQLSDNINWIESAMDNKMVVAVRREFYMQMQRVELKLLKHLMMQ